MINVTKAYLPPMEEYTAILKRAWDKAWITNNGELSQELETRLKEYLEVDYLLYTGNGTIVLQMALKVFNIRKEVITTPFSYVATTNAILWEGCKPVFVDIKPDNFCIDADKIESAITENTQAILATHVYGYPCDVEKIEKIAEKYKLKVIYDAAHAFGGKYLGKSLLNYGDISTCSFHATKIFHTVEGGCIICKDEKTYKQLSLYRSFGHIADDYYSVGINGKNSEFHAAMGLCILPKMETIISRRKQLSDSYDNLLNFKKIKRVAVSDNLEYNYAYYPVLFESEEVLTKVVTNLLENHISPRRYFYPSLNKLPFLEYCKCEVSESVAKKILCLPLFHDLLYDDIVRTTDIINNTI